MSKNLWILWILLLISLLKVVFGNCIQTNIYECRAIDIPYSCWITKCINIKMNLDANLSSYQYEITRGLYIQDSILQTIPAAAFGHYNNLRALKVNDARTEFLQPGSLSGIGNLVILSFANNSIGKIPHGIFSGLSYLRYLDLSNNTLTHIDVGAFDGIVHLQYLNLSNCLIQSIHESCFSVLINLNSLDLSYNKISLIEPLTFNNLYQLQYLNVSNNKIKTFFPKSLNSLRSLIQLNLRNNTIHPNAFKDLRGSVDISNNQIKFLDDFGPYILKLNIKHNQFEKIQGILFNSSKIIRELILSDNKIKSIDNDAFVGLHVLETMFLDNNQLSDIKIGTFRELKFLIMLNLSSNSLENLEYGLFTGLIKLNTLDITNNRISNLQINSFYPMINLKILKLDRNFILSFDAEKLVRYMGTLQQISMDQNYISCERLTNMFYVFRKASVKLLHGFNYKIHNVNGVSCKVPEINNSIDKTNNRYSSIYTDKQIDSVFIKGIRPNLTITLPTLKTTNIIKTEFTTEITTTPSFNNVSTLKNNETGKDKIIISPTEDANILTSQDTMLITNNMQSQYIDSPEKLVFNYNEMKNTITELKIVSVFTFILLCIFVVSVVIILSQNFICKKKNIDVNSKIAACDIELLNND